MQLSRRIAKTISVATLFAMFAVPAMAGATPLDGFRVNNSPGNGKNMGDNSLLARGGSSDEAAGNGFGSGSRDRDGSRSGDRDQDRDGTCSESVTGVSAALSLILARSDSGDQDKDRDQTNDRDQARDGSCLT